MIPTLVSLIVISHAYGRFLRQAVESCVDQTYSNVEIVIVGSRPVDETPQIAHSLVAENPGKAIKYILSPDGDVELARNAGVQNSSGEFLCWLDADDFLHKMYIEKAVKLSTEGFDIVAPAIFVTDAQGIVVREHRPTPPFTLERFVTANPIVCSALFTRIIFERVGWCTPFFGPAGDWHFWCKCLAVGAKIGLLTTPCFYYRAHPDSDSAKWRFKTLPATITDKIKAEFGSLAPEKPPKKFQLKETWNDNQRRKH